MLLLSITGLGPIANIDNRVAFPMPLSSPLAVTDSTVAVTVSDASTSWTESVSLNCNTVSVSASKTDAESSTPTVISGASLVAPTDTVDVTRTLFCPLLLSWNVTSRSVVSGSWERLL